MRNDRPSVTLKCPACRRTTPHRLLYIKNGCDILQCRDCGLGRTEASSFDPIAYYDEGYFSGRQRSVCAEALPMMGQLMLTALLALVLVYAWSAHRTVPIIGLLASGAALAGLYFVWVPDHATALAAFAGIGRGSDLIVYTWVVISLLITLNLHLKLRLQLDMITRLARAVAIDRAKESRRETGPPRKRRPVMLDRKAEAPPIELQAKK